MGPLQGYKITAVERPSEEISYEKKVGFNIFKNLDMLMSIELL